MTKSTGGSAFPTIPIYNGDDEVIAASAGMTLRDYFAAQALPVLAGRSWAHIPEADLIPTWAQSVYAIADAMLAEREKP